MKKLTKQARKALTGLCSITLLSTGILWGSLSAHDELVYSEQDTLITGLGSYEELIGIEVLKEHEVITTCTYPQEADKVLCDGFSLRDDGLYMTSSLQPGAIEDTYVPYTYRFSTRLETQETNTTELIIKRKPNDTALSLQGGTLTLGEQPFEVNTKSQDVVLSSDDPDHVSFGEGTIKIAQGVKDELLITATIPETAQREGKSVFATYSIAEEQKEATETASGDAQYPDHIEILTEENIAMLKMSTADANEWNGEWINLSVEVSLQNKDEQFTQSFVGAIPNYQVQLQAQFVNLLEDPNVPADLTTEKIESGTMTQQEIDALFAGKSWMGGSAIDTSKPYTNKETKLWVQYLSVPFPHEEGIYVTRYRLFNKFSSEVVPIVMDGKTYSEETGYFDTVMRNGIDVTSPEVTIEAKRDGESNYHELQDGELLGNNAQIKITSNGDISGIREQKYQFVKTGEELKENAWTPIPNDGIVIAPADFGGTLEVSVHDNVALDENKTKYRATKISKQILAPVNYVVVTLPQSSNEWKSMDKGILWLIEPTNNTVNYDGVFMTFVNLDNNEVTTKFINKSAFVQRQYEFDLKDGEWQITAEVVKAKTNTPSDQVKRDEYDLVDPLSKTTTQLSIDNTAKVTATRGVQNKQTYGIIVRGTSGPSGIKMIKKTMSITTADGVKTYTSTIHPDVNGEYQDQASLNGTYTYVLTNNAGKESDPASVTITGLNNTKPVLDIHAKDSMGIEVQTGDTADKYIVISADDINPDSDGSKIQICINNVCTDYTLGEDVMVEEDAIIIFKDSDGEELGKFEVTITGNYNLGAVEITNENEFGDEVWLGEDTSVNVALNGGDPDVYMEAKVGGEAYKKLDGKTAVIPIAQAENSSGKTLVLVRSSDGEHVSQPQRVMVNIDKITPTLTIKQEHNQLNSQSLASFTVKTGGSGLKSATVKHDTDTINLTINNNSIEDYPMSDNGTYTFTITAGNGRTATESVTVTGLNENVIHVSAFVGDVDQANSYDGSWTKETVTFKLSGGLKDMNQFSKYQMKTTKGEWKDCTDTITLTDEQNETLEFQVVLKDGSTSSQTDVFPVKIDTLPPSDPLITIHKLNDNSVARFLRSITFDQFMKEGRSAEITSSDTGSGATIYYQFADAKGEFDTDLTSNKWIKYDGVITLNKEGNVAIAAYAIDEVGHHSDRITNSDGMVFDFTAPVLTGVDGDSGYIPRTVTYEDSISGLADTQVFTFNDKNMTLTQGTKLKETGNYHFEISDRAGNVTIKDFTLKPLPNPDDIDGSDETKDIIDDIKDEFDKNKGDLDDDTQKEIQDQIDDIEDAFKKQRTDHLEDKETGASLDGINDTTFPKDAILSVKRITEEVSESDRTKYEDYADQLQEKADVSDLYEVKITLDGKELALHGSATLTIKREEETKRFAYIEEAMMKELGVTNVETGFTSVIEHTGKYATLIDDQNKGGNEDEINHIEDEESGAVIDGINGTTFPKNTILRVRKITSELNEEEQNTYQMQANALSRELMDVYEVTLTCDDKPIVLTGSAELTIPMETKPDGVAFIQDHVMQERSFTMNDTNIHMEITSVGRYATLTGSENYDPNDPNNPDDPYDPNGGNQGDGSGNGTSGNGYDGLGNYYGGGLNTGDVTNYGILFVITMMSFMILLHARNILNNKGDE